MAPALLRQHTAVTNPPHKRSIASAIIAAAAAASEDKPLQCTEPKGPSDTLHMQFGAELADALPELAAAQLVAKTGGDLASMDDYASCCLQGLLGSFPQLLGQVVRKLGAWGSQGAESEAQLEVGCGVHAHLCAL